MTTQGLVDFHCHLDLFPDHPVAVQEAEEAGVFTLAVTTTPRAWSRNVELARTTRRVRVALGLHPQLLTERADELPLWESLLPEARYVGEVGLDAGPRFYGSFELQKRVFKHILQCCDRAGGKVLSVHSVRSAKIVLDHIEAYLPIDKGRVVLHWFTGTRSELKRAIEMGCYFSINGMMLTKDRGQDIVKAIPLDRLLTETDAPFGQVDGRAAKPTDVSRTVEALARMHGIDATSVASMIRENLRVLVDFAD